MTVRGPRCSLLRSHTAASTRWSASAPQFCRSGDPAAPMTSCAGLTRAAVGYVKFITWLADAPNSEMHFVYFTQRWCFSKPCKINNLQLQKEWPDLIPGICNICITKSLPAVSIVVHCEVCISSLYTYCTLLYEYHWNLPFHCCLICIYIALLFLSLTIHASYYRINPNTESNFLEFSFHASIRISRYCWLIKTGEQHI